MPKTIPGIHLISPPRRQQAAPFLLTLLLVAGLGLRLANLAHGLPEIYSMDEGLVTYYALNMGGGDLNPHTFLHPHLYYYLCFFVDVVYILSGMVAGIFQVPGDAWKLYQSDPTVFFLIGRLVSALLGVLTIPVTYLVGRRIFNKRIGLLAAFFLTLSFLHIQWSQIGYMDAPLTFLATLAFLLACHSLETERMTCFILAGFVSGLASATKYQGLVTLLWGPAARLLSFWQRRERGQNPVGIIFDGKVLLFLFFAFIGFTVAMPYWILDFSRFLEHWTFNWEVYGTHARTQLGFERDWNWFYYLRGPLAYGLGLPVLMAGLGGVILLARRHRPEDIFFLSFPVVYFLIAGASKVSKPSYILPLLPFLCLLGALFLFKVVRRFIPHEGRVFSGALIGLSLLMILPGSFRVARYLSLHGVEDTRLTMGKWMMEELPKDTKILFSFYVGGKRLHRHIKGDRLDPTVLNIHEGNRSSLKTLDEYRGEGYQYLVLDDWFLGNIFVEGGRDEKYTELIKRYRNFMQEVRERAELVRIFSPYRDPSLGYERDNVQIPTLHLKGMRSPGPKIWVYRL